MRTTRVKGDSPELLFSMLINEVERLGNCKVKNLRSERGTEFYNEAMESVTNKTERG